MDQETQKKIEQIADHYGLENQSMKMIEEASELSRAIARRDLENTLEELADVKIMVAQMEHLLGRSTDEWVKRKVKRQLKRIKNETAAMIDCPWRRLP